MIQTMEETCTNNHFQTRVFPETHVSAEGLHKKIDIQTDRQADD